MNFLYDCDLNYLKTYINNSLKSEQIKILKDIKIKERIINEDHYQFVWFIQKMSDEIVLLLLDEMGIEILSKSERIVDKINALITSCKNYVNKLFDNEKFLEMIINNINSLALYLSSVDDIASEKLINYLQKTNNMDLFYNRIFHNISLESQQNFVSNNIIPYEKLKHMIFRSHKKVSEYIIENDSRISGLEFSYNDIANLFVKKIDVYHLLRQTNILNEIVTCLSPIYYRNLIKILEFSNDTQEIEMKRKKHIDNFLKKYNKNEQMFEPFFNIYNDILNTKNNSWEIYEKHLPYIDLMLYMLLMTNSDNTNKEVYIKESNNLISSMIIDYHFNEYDLNVFIDIKQLLEFNKMIKNLSDEDVKLYNKILNIYELSYEEKMQLHEYLKSINMIEKFYDHIRNSKNISYNLFKEKSLNTNSLFNKEKSKELDIDVYELKGEEFTALIKAGVSYSSKIDKPSGCFSMIGDNCLGTYGTPDDRITIVYGDFDPNYIIHMFTEDSYSAPVTDDTTEVTNRVNLIMTPEEFQKNTCTYNEVVINYGKNLGNDIVIPKSKFILCYDEIKEIHKKAALDFKLPILVIHTKYYDKTKNKTEIEQRSYYVDALNVEKIRTQR